MYIYNVTINVDSAIQEEWLKWMREVHIPDVMNTGCFVENQIIRVLGDDEGHTFSIQYKFQTMDDYNRYHKDFAPALQKEVRDRYEGKFAAFRTLLEIL
jgi:hypothetical protein